MPAEARSRSRLVTSLEASTESAALAAGQASSRPQPVVSHRLTVGVTETLRSPAGCTETAARESAYAYPSAMWNQFTRNSQVEVVATPVEPSATTAPCMSWRSERYA